MIETLIMQVRTFFFPLALSLSSCCFALPNTLKADVTFLVCTAFKLSHTSLTSCSAKPAYRGFVSCREMMMDMICFDRVAKAAFEFGLQVSMLCRTSGSGESESLSQRPV